MLNSAFEGHLTKHTFRNADGNVFTEMAIKTVVPGDLQTFGSKIAKAIEKSVNISTLFTSPIQWKRVVIDLESLHHDEVKVMFDEMEFGAFLKTLTVTQKVKDDSVNFEYSLALTKECETDFDTKFATTYLKYKEEDPETGKKHIKNFFVEITVGEPSEVVVKASDIADPED